MTTVTKPKLDFHGYPFIRLVVWSDYKFGGFQHNDVECTHFYRFKDEDSVIRGGVGNSDRTFLCNGKSITFSDILVRVPGAIVESWVLALCKKSSSVLAAHIELMNAGLELVDTKEGLA